MLLNNPARFRERADIVQVSAVRRHRSRNVGHGHGFCISSLRLRLRLAAPFGEGVGSLRSPTPAQPKVFCMICRRHSPRRVPPRNESCLVSADHLLLHGEGIGSLQLRLQALTLRYATVHFFRLRFRSPMPGERGTKKRRRNLSEPFPPTPSRRNKRKREQVECAGVTANSSASSRCSLRSRLSLSVSALHHRLRMERRHRRWLQHSVGVNRSGAFRPGSDHASLLPFVCYCLGSSHRTRSVGHGSCRGAFRQYRQHHRQPTR